jgi:hypothetical protein
VYLDTRNALQGEIQLHFGILEQNDGAELQLLYAGGPEIDVVIDGSIEGRRPILDVPYKALKPGKPGELWSMLFTLTFSLVAITWVARDTLKVSRKGQWRRAWVLGPVILAAIILASLVFVFIQDAWPVLRAPHMPFDF